MVTNYPTRESYSIEGKIRISPGPGNLVDTKQLKRDDYEKPSATNQCSAAGVDYKKICPCYMTGFPIIANDGDCILGHNCEHIIALAQLILLCGLAGKPFEDAITEFFSIFFISGVIARKWKEWREGIVGRYERGAPREEEGGGVRGSVYSLSGGGPNQMKKEHAWIRMDLGHPDGIIFLKSDSSYQIHYDWLTVNPPPPPADTTTTGSGAARVDGWAPNQRIKSARPVYHQWIPKSGTGGGAAGGGKNSQKGGSGGPPNRGKRSTNRATPPYSGPGPRVAPVAAAPPPVAAAPVKSPLCVDPNDCIELNGPGPTDDDDKNKIICWKSIYWLLCSLIGKNQAPGVNDGGTNSSDWRESITRLIGSQLQKYASPQQLPKGFSKFDDSMILRSETSYARPPPTYRQMPDKTETEKEAKKAEKQIWLDGVRTNNENFNKYVEKRFWLPRLGNENPIVESDPSTGCITKLPLIINGESRGNVNADVWIGQRAEKIAEQLKHIIDKIDTTDFRDNRLLFTAISIKVFGVYLYKKSERRGFDKIKVKLTKIIAKVRNKVKLDSDSNKKIRDNLILLIQKISIVFASEVYQGRLERGVQTADGKIILGQTAGADGLPAPIIESEPEPEHDEHDEHDEGIGVQNPPGIGFYTNPPVLSGEPGGTVVLDEVGTVLDDLHPPFSAYIKGITFCSDGEMNLALQEEIIQYYRTLCQSLGFFDPIPVTEECQGFLEHNHKFQERGRIIAEALDSFEETLYGVYEKYNNFVIRQSEEEDEPEEVLNYLLEIKELYNRILYVTQPEEEVETGSEEGFEPEAETGSDPPALAVPVPPGASGNLKKTRKRRKKKNLTHKKKKKNKSRNKSQHKNKKKKKNKRTINKENSLYQKILKRLGY